MEPYVPYQTERAVALWGCHVLRPTILKLRIFRANLEQTSHLRLEGDDVHLLPLSNFLADIPDPTIGCAALWMSFSFAVSPGDWLTTGVTGSSLGNSLLNGCERYLAMLSALSSPCFYLTDTNFVPRVFSPCKILLH